MHPALDNRKKNCLQELQPTRTKEDSLYRARQLVQKFHGIGETEVSITPATYYAEHFYHLKKFKLS